MINTNEDIPPSFESQMILRESSQFIIPGVIFTISIFPYPMELVLSYISRLMKQSQL